MLSAECYQLIFRLILQMLSGYHNLSFGRFFQTCQHIQQSGFTGPGGSHNRTKSASLDGEANAIKSPHLFVTNLIYFIQIFNRNNRFIFFHISASYLFGVLFELVHLIYVIYAVMSMYFIHQSSHSLLSIMNAYSNSYIGQICPEIHLPLL